MSTKLKILNVELGDKSYPIYIGRDLLSDKTCLEKHISGQQVMVVTNSKIEPLYLDKINNLLGNFEVQVTILPDGEQYKTLETVNSIFDALLEAKFDRSATLIALGGGVVGDITGFAAASYLRGVDFIQIPTTLLAMVDASVGGKLGIANVDSSMGSLGSGTRYSVVHWMISVAAIKLKAKPTIKKIVRKFSRFFFQFFLLCIVFCLGFCFRSEESVQNPFKRV